MDSDDSRQVVRRARPEDASRVEAAVAAAFEVHIAMLGRMPGPMLVDYQRALWRDDLWVVCEGADIVAVLHLETHADRCEVLSLSVRPEHRARGIGRMLLGLAERETRRKGRARLGLVLHPQARGEIAYLQRRGFREIRAAAEEIVLVRHLRPPPAERAAGCSDEAASGAR